MSSRVDQGGSIGLAIVLAILLDLIDKRFRYPEQATHELGLDIFEMHVPDAIAVARLRRLPLPPALRRAHVCPRGARDEASREEADQARCGGQRHGRSIMPV